SACHRPDTTVQAAAMETSTTLPPETTITLPPTTTTMARVVLERASRGAVRPRPRFVAEDVHNLPLVFWDLLSNCEDGHQQEDSKPYDDVHSFFQWMITSKWNSWEAAGGMGMPEEHSFEEQRDIAEHWASVTNPYQQWPVCWPEAMRQLDQQQ